MTLSAFKTGKENLFLFLATHVQLVETTCDAAQRQAKAASGLSGDEQCRVPFVWEGAVVVLSGPLTGCASVSIAFSTK